MKFNREEREEHEGEMALGYRNIIRAICGIRG